MKTYSNGTYSVTINSDRSINVRSGDWISKYSAAIFNDPHANWGNYKRKLNGQYVDIPNPNAINAGEVIYYVGDLPNFTGSPPPPGICPLPLDDTPPPPPTPDRLNDFFNWIMSTLCPVSDWSVVGSNDLGGGLVLQGQAFQVGLKHVDEDDPRWFSGVGVGAGTGPTVVKGGVTWSSTQFSNFVAQHTGLSGLSFVAKVVTSGSVLTPREFSGTFMRFDAGGSALGGGAISVLAVGMKSPPEFAFRKVLEMYAGHSEFSWIPIAPMAVIFLSGVNLGFDCGASIKVGQMWETSSYFWNYL